jgi:hypothetical protein
VAIFFEKNSISPQYTKKVHPKNNYNYTHTRAHTHTHIIFLNLEIKVFLCSEEENISDKNMRKTKKMTQKDKMENKLKIEKIYEAAATLRPSFVFSGKGEK